MATGRDRGIGCDELSPRGPVPSSLTRRALVRTARPGAPVHHEKASTISSISASSRSRKPLMNLSVSGLARAATPRKEGSGWIPARLAAWCRKATSYFKNRRCPDVSVHGSGAPKIEWNKRFFGRLLVEPLMQ